MKLKGYDITIRQGETFSIDYLLQNRDGSPYIISNKSTNPYFLITVASTKYFQSGRYVKNYWLQIPKKNTFYVTNAIERQNFNGPPVIPSGELHTDLETYAVYYVVDKDGTKIYKRWLNNEWVDYELRINKTFLTSDTEEWTGQSYVYDISYVDGISMLSYLQSLYRDEYDAEAPDNVEDLYNELSKIDKYKTIPWTRALGRIDINAPIISAAKLSVLTNINGGSN